MPIFICFCWSKNDNCVFLKLNLAIPVVSFFPRITLNEWNTILWNANVYLASNIIKTKLIYIHKVGLYLEYTQNTLPPHHHVPQPIDSPPKYLLVSFLSTFWIRVLKLLLESASSQESAKLKKNYICLKIAIITTKKKNIELSYYKYIE